MKHLSGLDATFLHLETPETPMHVGSLQLLTLPAGFEGDFAQRVREFVGGRLHLAEVFQRKLALMPFDIANPAWIDDDDVDLDYHVRHVMLPRPGTMKQLEQYVARLHSSLLDRSRPLWEFYVIEGLQSGQVGFYSKVHHAGIDGQAGVALAKALLDLTPEPRVVKPPRAKRRVNDYQLGVAELLTAAVRNTAVQFVTVVRTLPAAAKALLAAVRSSSASAADAGDDSGSGIGSKKKRFSLSPRTPLNVSITNQRAFAGRIVPLAELKQMARMAGVTLNDLVLAECAGALRRFLAEQGCEPARPLSAGVPVSLRSESDTQANNQVSGMIVSLATDIADPLERLRAIHASSNAAKGLTGFLKALPTDVPALGAPWLMSGLASLYGRSRLADRLPPIANVAISNVPGPPVPLYLAGAQVDAYMPLSIVTHGLALNITVQSYNGALAYGLTACRRALPDVGDLADQIVAEHQRLKARIEEAAAASQRPAGEAAAKSVRPAAKPASPAAARRARVRTAAKESADVQAAAIAQPSPAVDVRQPPARKRAASARAANGATAVTPAATVAPATPSATRPASRRSRRSATSVTKSPVEMA